MNLSLERKRQIIRYTTILGIILTVVGFIYISKSTYFEPGQGFEKLLRGLGIFAPIIFVFVQISQIIYPIIPLGLTNVIGFLIFGVELGTVLNVIGLITGSAINFYLGRKFGGTIVKAFISDEDYEKYVGVLNRGEAFDRLLMIGFIAPIFPDDIFCMIAGMSDMRFKRFMKYVILYRPTSMFIYTFMTTYVVEFIDKLLN